MKLTIKEISVNTAALGKDIEQLVKLVEKLERDNTKMSQEIRELNRMWQGPSNEAFNIQFQADRVSFDNLCKAIRKMIQAMEIAKGEYEQCDNRVYGLVNGLRI